MYDSITFVLSMGNTVGIRVCVCAGDSLLSSLVRLNFEYYLRLLTEIPSLGIVNGRLWDWCFREAFHCFPIRQNLLIVETVIQIIGMRECNYILKIENHDNKADLHSNTVAAGSCPLTYLVGSGAD